MGWWTTHYPKWSINGLVDHTLPQVINQWVGGPHTTSSDQSMGWWTTLPEVINQWVGGPHTTWSDQSMGWWTTHYLKSSFFLGTEWWITRHLSLWTLIGGSQIIFLPRYWLVDYKSSFSLDTYIYWLVDYKSSFSLDTDWGITSHPSPWTLIGRSQIIFLPGCWLVDYTLPQVIFLPGYSDRIMYYVPC